MPPGRRRTVSAVRLLRNIRAAEMLLEEMRAFLRVAALAKSEKRSPDNLCDAERRHILGVLEAHQFHRGDTAKALGLSQRTLYRRLRNYGGEK